MLSVGRSSSCWVQGRPRQRRSQRLWRAQGTSTLFGLLHCNNVHVRSHFRLVDLGRSVRRYCPFDHDKIWIRFFGRLGTARHFSRPNFCSGTRCAHQFWPQCARSAASAGARLAAGPAAGQAARARARIQPKSPRASSQISEFRSCMHSVSWIHARAGGWEAAHAMEWARLPGRGGL